MMLMRLATGVQSMVVTPVILKAPELVIEVAGLTVMAKLVATDKLPGSVAVTVTEKGDPTVVEGVPLMVLPLNVRPGGNPLADKVN